MTTSTATLGKTPCTTRRTPVDVILERPSKVTFGGKVYEVAPAKIDQDMRWREKCGEFAGEFFGTLAQFSKPGGAIDQRAAIVSIMPMLATKGLDRLMDLLFIYAPDLPRDEIEAVATLDEKLDAVVEVLRLALPFILKLANLMQMMETAV